MKYLCGLYLAANKARHSGHHIMYQDIDESYHPDLIGDMLDYMNEQTLKNVSYIIATPPCNWWSKANPYYWRSEYSLKTRHLLPLILIKLGQQKKALYSGMCKESQKIQRKPYFQDMRDVFHQLSNSWKTCIFLKYKYRCQLSTNSRLQVWRKESEQ